jgi:glycosyltransferase involved in cell wall biosynthesis
MTLDLDVWIFATVPWDFALVGRTRHLALGLRDLGARVTFVEPADLKKSLRRLRRPQAAPDGIRLLSMPPTVARLTDRLPLVPRLHDATQRLWLEKCLAGHPPPVALVSTPRWAPIIAGLPFSRVVYDCLDDLKVLADPARLARFTAWEKELVARASACFAVTPLLARDLSARGARRVQVLGNGVSFDDFVRRARPPDPKGEEKRIGYLGALYEWIDVDVLAHVARAMPEHELVLVGPQRRGVDLSALAQLPNVRLCGYRAPDEVPRAIASFDVALVPFKEGDVARASDPIKIYEYFCFGLPVVTTPVGDLDSLRELLHVASGKEAFVEAIRAALDERQPGLRERRIAYARSHDWRVRAEAMGAVLLGLVASRV